MAGRRWTRAWRRAVMRVLASALPRGDSTAAPDWRARPYRVLFMRHQRVGDLLMATGAIRAIATSCPTISVDVLASPGGVPVLLGNAHVRDVVAFEARKWWTWPRVMRRLRRARYDVVVDGRVNQEPAFTTTIALMIATGARCRIGAHVEGSDGVFTLPVRVDDRAHFVEQTATTAIPFGVDPAGLDLRPSLFLTEAERAHAATQWMSSDAGAPPPDRPCRVLVNVSVSIAARRWPEERYIAVLQHLRSRNPHLRILVTGIPADADEIARIASATGARFMTPILRDVMALVATADLVLTPNTAISHVASAVGTPIVEMLPKSHGAFVAYRAAGRSLLGSDDTLVSVALERVIEAVDAVIDEGAAAGWRR